jgi:hypothetical protein
MAQALLNIIAFSPFKKSDNDIQREHTGVETQLSAINGFHSDLLQNNFLIVFPILQETTFDMLSKDTHPKRSFFIDRDLDHFCIPRKNILLDGIRILKKSKHI